MIKDHQVDYFELKKNKEKLAAGGDLNINLTRLKAKKGEIEVEYEFKITYKEKSGHLIMKGSLVAEDKDAKKTVEAWEKTKKLPDGLSRELLNHIVNLNRIRAAGTLRALSAKFEVKKEQRGYKPAA